MHVKHLLSVVLNAPTALDTGCWGHRLAVNGNGYRNVLVDGRLSPLHREMYKLLVGPIEDGYECHHECGNKWCCNPGHLKLTTRREHVRCDRAMIIDQIQRTHCPAGHPYDDENTYLDKKNCRHCKACTTERNRKTWRKYYYAKKTKGC